MHNNVYFCIPICDLLIPEVPEGCQNPESNPDVISCYEKAHQKFEECFEMCSSNSTCVHECSGECTVFLGRTDSRNFDTS